MKALPVISSLPAGFYREIGRLAVLDAHIDWLLSRTIFEVLHLDPKAGRLAVNAPRASQRLEIIQELLKLKRMKVDIDFRVLRANIKDEDKLVLQAGYALEKTTNLPKDPIVK